MLTPAQCMQMVPEYLAPLERERVAELRGASDDIRQWRVKTANHIAGRPVADSWTIVALDAAVP